MKQSIINAVRRRPLRNIFLGFSILIATAINGCGFGATSISELSAIVVQSLSSKDSVAIVKATPGNADMKKAFESYFGDQYKSPDELKEKSQEWAINNQLELLRQTGNVKAEGRYAGIDWNKVKMANFSYNELETKEAYKQAIVSVLVSNAKTDLNTIVFNAVQFNNKWYLYKADLHWQRTNKKGG